MRAHNSSWLQNLLGRCKSAPKCIHGRQVSLYKWHRGKPFNSVHTCGRLYESKITTPICLNCCRQQCFTCDTAPPYNGSCYPVADYERLTVSEHGRLAGRADMMAEIRARGPISCTINATRALDKCASLLYAGSLILIKLLPGHLHCEGRYASARGNARCHCCCMRYSKPALAMASL